MHKLRPPKVSLDDNFNNGFIEKEVEKEEMKMGDLIREWWYDSNIFKIISEKIYHIQILNNPPILVLIILYCLYGEKYFLKFKLGWVPLIHEVLKG